MTTFSNSTLSTAAAAGTCSGIFLILCLPLVFPAETGFAGALADDRVVVVDFAQTPLPGFVQFNNTAAPAPASEGGLDVRFEKADWPNVYFQAPEAGWDWSPYTGVGITLFNPGPTAVAVAMRLDNKGADGTNNCSSLQGSIAPDERLEFRMAFKKQGPKALWGMRGVPGDIPEGNGAPLDLKAISAFQLFLPRPEAPCTLRLEALYLFGDATVPALIPLPFVDRFGQYKHADWPGKLASEADFADRIREEDLRIAAEPALPDRDRFGGWKDGPRLEATGRFRTEQVDGKWWLVTPEGTLFFSLGVDCVWSGEQTFIEKREPWFEWLPAKDDPIFGALLGRMEGAHSMAEPISGAGATFSFYTANLIRKYGDDWQNAWRQKSCQRLSHWGFNTVGNWSQGDILDAGALPFVTSIHLGQARRIETATGYWGKMIDVYDPTFEASVEPAAAGFGAKYSQNPLCIGCFSDNELAWEGVVKGVLTGVSGQPARDALVQFLQEKYRALKTLNTAWASDFSSWESITVPAARNAAFREDMDAYLFRFARLYFSVIRDALNRHAPGHLYLGCRFSGAPVPVVRACAEIADVVSFNLYHPVIPSGFWSGENNLNKPMMIGEFHFGALDRGMFHTGLVSTANQEARAAQYAAYVRSVLEHPGFVGCHWFQYADEPLTGRWLDGENYNIGFVNVTDTPYPELSEAAREIHRKAYSLRYGASTRP